MTIGGIALRIKFIQMIADWWGWIIWVAMVSARRQRIWGRERRFFLTNCCFDAYKIYDPCEPVCQWTRSDRFDRNHHDVDLSWMVQNSHIQKLSFIILIHYLNYSVKTLVLDSWFRKIVRIIIFKIQMWQL